MTAVDKKRPEVRLCLALIAIFALVASKGVGFVEQALSWSEPGRSMLRELGAPDGGATGGGVALYARAEQAAPFLDGPLRIATLPAAAEAVSNVLRVWPFAGAYWARLAEIRAASGSDIRSVIAAYQMSVLVAPFDGDMMVARQALGVQLWDVLPMDDQRSVLTDLVSVWNARPAELTSRLRKATASLSPGGRKTLKAELKARSGLLDQQLAVIGL